MVLLAAAVVVLVVVLNWVVVSEAVGGAAALNVTPSLLNPAPSWLLAALWSASRPLNE